MEKIILVSNRLSVSVHRNEEGKLLFQQSMGGLATGLSSLLEQQESRWVGWSGLPEESFSPQEKETVEEKLRSEYHSIPVSLSGEELDSFYYGFCNNIIWPLFHYFPTYVDYDQNLWDAYRKVNEKYLHKVLEVAGPEDTIWVHDYQLMLLPGMIKNEIKNAKIGFFLHIPFPSYEIFRLLPWRDELLKGLMGSDLIGFHTYDYARHFLSSVRRLLGYEHNLGNIPYRNRMVNVDVFPMGIDYPKYHNSSDDPEIKEEIDKVKETLHGRKLILSVDRLDYTKGILQRIRAYKFFLEKYPDYREKVNMIIIVAPSRTQVNQYIELKKEVDELVSEVNGTMSTIDWTPIRYFYRPFPFNQLTAIYSLADVLLVTPIRDGMNLIAKEYVAARKDMEGAIVLSETAGASKELGEALIINPSNTEEIADNLKIALEMPREEKIYRNKVMNQRLKRYNVNYWAGDFIDKLNSAVKSRKTIQSRKIEGEIKDQIKERFKNAERRLVILDYDGTLVSYGTRPQHAKPDKNLQDLLKKASSNPKNEIVLTTGRDKSLIDEWFQDLNAGFIASHGVWYKMQSDGWQLMETLGNEWKEAIYPILELYVDRTPGSVIEEKDYSLVWHYRRAEPELSANRLSELREALISLTSNYNLSLLEINKSLEIKPGNINKNHAVSHWLGKAKWDIIICIGDDPTDEDLFLSLPDHADTIRVGLGITNAKYYLESVNHVWNFVSELTDI
ncbi:MAG: bifunctional alpha,alpha-trehalose-phosphate synthase (UDP-forming)/trehalose-phosphatase [Spirochaetia bacterium]